MKTEKKNKEKEFDTVKTFREIKEKISKELFGKTADEIKEILKKKSLNLNID